MPAGKRPACESMYEDYVGRMILTSTSQTQHFRLTSRPTPMKEIIQRAVVIDPAFRSKMTLVTVKKSRVFVVPLKFNQRKMVSLHKRAKPCVIVFASRTRDAFLVVRIAGDRHTKQQWSSVNACQRAQEQFQISPTRGCVHVLSKCHVTTTKGLSFVRTRGFCHLVCIGGALGSAHVRNELRPIELFLDETGAAGLILWRMQLDAAK